MKSELARQATLCTQQAFKKKQVETVDDKSQETKDFVDFENVS